MAGFEGIGDFDSDDPWQRYIAHQAAKGNYPARPTSTRQSSPRKDVVLIKVDTVAELTEAFSELGSLQSNLEIWDTSGNQYLIENVYVAEGQENENIVCIDIEIIK